MTDKLILQMQPSATFQVTASRTIVTFNPDGTITLGDGLKPDEAAKEFLKVVQETYPKLFECKREHK